MKKKQRFTSQSLFRYAFQAVIFAILATIGVVLFYTDPETFEHLRQVNWGMKIWLLIMIVFAWLCNGMRIYLLTRSLGYPIRYIQSLSVSLSSEFGIAATPAGVGGAAIRLTLLKRAGVPLAHGTSMLAMDVALDSLFFVLLIPFALWSIVRNEKIHSLFRVSDPLGLILVLMAVGLGMVLLVRVFCSCWCRAMIHRMARHPSLLHYRLPARLRLVRVKATHGFHQMTGGFVQLLQLRWGAVALTFLCACMQWTCRYSILPLLLYGLSIPCDPILLFFLQGFLFTGSLLFVLPGGGGGVEVSAAIILRQIIPPYLVGVVVLLWRFFTYHLYLLGGGAMFLWTFTHIHRLFPSTEKEGEEEILFE